MIDMVISNRGDGLHPSFTTSTTYAAPFSFERGEPS
jgi:hypothetical protein